MERRVVVTGIGLITPLGVGTKETWDGILSGRSGVKTIERFDPSDLKSRIAGEITDFDPELYMNAKEARKTDRFIQYAVSGAKLALDDAGLEITDDLSERTGTVIGTGIGGMETYESTVMKMEKRRLLLFRQRMNWQHRV